VPAGVRAGAARGTDVVPTSQPQLVPTLALAVPFGTGSNGTRGIHGRSRGGSPGALKAQLYGRTPDSDTSSSSGLDSDHGTVGGFAMTLTNPRLNHCLQLVAARQYQGVRVDERRLLQCMSCCFYLRYPNQCDLLHYEILGKVLTRVSG
jgi:hypothetical protein